MIVVDASAIVAALVERGAASLRARLVIEELHAPSLVDHEVVAAMRSLVLRGALSPSRAEDALDDLDDLPIERWPVSPPLRRRVWGLRANLSSYDGWYVALAEALGCPVVSRDERLARAPGHVAVVEVL